MQIQPESLNKIVLKLDDGDDVRYIIRDVDGVLHIYIEDSYGNTVGIKRSYKNSVLSIVAED